MIGSQALRSSRSLQTNRGDPKLPGMAHASVLLVEPSADDREMYSEYLTVRGFAVDVCTTAETAFDRASAADAVVTSVRLPGEYDGVEFVRRLRQNARTASTPIIVLTASTFSDDQRRAYAAGCDTFLVKPCLPDALANEIRRVVRSADRRRASRRNGAPRPYDSGNDRRRAYGTDRRR